MPKKKQRYEKVIKNSAFSLITVCIFFIALELLFDVYYLITDRDWVSVQNKLISQTYSSSQSYDPTGCVWADSHYFHPYVGWVNKKEPPCGSALSNSDGFNGPAIPFKKEPGTFVILLTGGSVAEMQATRHKDLDESDLQKELNLHYTNSKIKKFIVLNGAMGGWKQPQAFINFSLYANVVDGVITLDGYNESNYVEEIALKRFEDPGVSFSRLIFGYKNWRSNLAEMVEGHLRRVQTENYLYRNSKFAYFIFSSIRGLLRQYIMHGSKDEQVKNYETENPFNFPENFTSKKKYNLDRYVQYTSMMSWIAQKLNIKALHLIQPLPIIGKTLTNEEKRVISPLRPDLKDRYLDIEKAMLNLNDQGIEVVSLLQVFRDYPETLYEDYVHYNARGRSIMNQAILKEITKRWGFKRKD